MTEVEITIQPNGSILLPADSPAQRQLILDVFAGVVEDPTHLTNFFEINESEIIFDDSVLCG